MQTAALFSCVHAGEEVMAVNDIAHKQMVQEVLKARFGSHKRLLCKANIQYPFQRVTNGYMRILN